MGFRIGSGKRNRPHFSQPLEPQSKTNDTKESQWAEIWKGSTEDRYDYILNDLFCQMFSYRRQHNLLSCPNFLHINCQKNKQRLKQLLSLDCEWGQVSHASSVLLLSWTFLVPFSFRQETERTNKQVSSAVNVTAVKLESANERHRKVVEKNNNKHTIIELWPKAHTAYWEIKARRRWRQRQPRKEHTIAALATIATYRHQQPIHALAMDDDTHTSRDEQIHRARILSATPAHFRISASGRTLANLHAIRITQFTSFELNSMRKGTEQT